MYIYIYNRTVCNHAIMQSLRAARVRVSACAEQLLFRTLGLWSGEGLGSRLFPFFFHVYVSLSLGMYGDGIRDRVRGGITYM